MIEIMKIINIRKMFLTEESFDRNLINLTVDESIVMYIIYYMTYKSINILIISIFILMNYEKN
jgi:hypothetical protein